MSSKTIEEMWRPIEEANFKAVQEETWGHLAPKKNQTYPGTMLFSLTAFGDYVIIDADFGELPSSPWIFEAMTAFVVAHATEEGAVYKFEGTFRNYEFKGPIAKLEL